MPRDREESQGLKIVLYFIKFRPRSEFEVREKLKQKKISLSTTEKIVTELKKKCLLDDRLFAKMWVESRMNAKPMGSFLLVRELGQKGIDKDLAAQILSDSGYDELKQAKEAAGRKMRVYRKYQDGLAHRSSREGGEFFQKMVSFLSRRGFNYGIAKEAIEELIQEGKGLNS